MRRLLISLGIITCIAPACKNGASSNGTQKDTTALQSITTPRVDSTKKSNFHYFPDGNAAPDYNKSIVDFESYLTKRTGAKSVARTIFVGKNREIVTEIYNATTGDFIGFSGDTSKLKWSNLEGQHLSKKLKDLIVKFGPEDAFIINKGKVEIGMTTDEAIAGWGKPNKIHKTTSNSGIHEQWVYDESYLYFDNGKLTSIQN